MKQLIKVSMALVLPVIAMMTLLTPMASAHATFHRHHPTFTQKPSSTTCFGEGCQLTTSVSTVSGMVFPRSAPYIIIAPCPFGSRVVGGRFFLSPPGFSRALSFTPTFGGTGARLVFVAFGRTSYIVTAFCSP